MKRIEIFITMMFVSLFCSNVNADENPFFFKTKVRYSPDVDVALQSGEIKFTKISTRIGYQKTLDNGYPFYVLLGPDHYVWTQSTSMSFPAGAKSRGFRIGTELGIPLIYDESYSIGIELNPTLQSSRGTALDGDSFRFNFSTFLKYNEYDDFVWIIGANIRPEYDMVILPIFGINYQLNDKLLINLVSDEPNISYKVTDNTKFLLELDYTFDEFEEIGGVLDGSILQIQEFAVGLGVKHQFNDHISSSLGVGGVFNRIIKYQDGSGKIVPEDGIYFNMGLAAVF